MLVTNDEHLVGTPKPILAPLHWYLSKYEPGTVPTYCVAAITVDFFCIGLVFRSLDNNGPLVGGIIIAITLIALALLLFILCGYYTSDKALRFKVSTFAVIITHIHRYPLCPLS